jgi:hypothetical protein
VIALRIPLEKELGSPGQNGNLEIHVILEQRGDRKHLRGAFDKAKVDDAEINLKLGVLKKVIGHDFRDGIAFDFDDDADAFLVRFIADIRDAIDDLVADELGHILDHRGFVHLIRDLGDDDAGFAVFFFFDVVFAPNRDRTGAGREVIKDALTA